MTFGVNHGNETDPGDDHTTDYGTGYAVVIVVLGLFLIGTIAATPWFLDTTYYTPLNRKQQTLYVVRADTPVVAKGEPVKAAVEVPAVSVATPDLSCLKTV